MATVHVTAEERDEIARLHAQKVSKRQIARLIGRDPTTITREFKRNSTTHRYSGRREYCPIAAQQLCEQRRHKPRKKKMEQQEIREYVDERIKEKYWSPDQVHGRMEIDFPDNPRMRISHETIYRHINQCDHPRAYRQCLRRIGVRKHRRKTTSEAAKIENRPAVIEQRERVGDWEGDTIVGAGRSGGVLSAVERKTGFTILAKVDNLKSATVTKRIIRRLKRVPHDQRKSITFDNGSEFAGHKQLAKSLQVDIYFADPHSPWQRGTNENTNGLVRQFLPKGTNFHDVSHQEVSRIQTLLNERPRKRLGYRTPQEMMQLDASRAMLT